MKATSILDFHEKFVQLENISFSFKSIQQTNYLTKMDEILIQKTSKYTL